jgi:hypothetical protein
MSFAVCSQGKNKNADVIERPMAFHHVGLLVNEPPGMAGLLFIQSSNDSDPAAARKLSRRAAEPS